jgi:hypothetical protein
MQSGKLWNLASADASFNRSLRFGRDDPIRVEDTLSDGAGPIRVEDTLSNGAGPIRVEDTLSDGAGPTLSNGAGPIRVEDTLSNGAGGGQKGKSKVKVQKCGIRLRRMLLLIDPSASVGMTKSYLVSRISRVIRAQEHQ